tara:strand:+ start:658 stop:876 length:219 start_codon:yes stop_codon:yes gene_type:complete
MAEAKLFELTVNINSDGKIITQCNYIERKILTTALDTWKKDYPNTHVIGAVVEYLKKVSYTIEEDVAKLCRS